MKEGELKPDPDKTKEVIDFKYYTVYFLICINSDLTKSNNVIDRDSPKPIVRTRQ